MPTGRAAIARSTSPGIRLRRRPWDGPLIGSYPRPPQRLAENTGRPEHENENEQDEGDDVAPAGTEQHLAVVLHHAEDQATEQGAAQVADAAEHGRAECLDAEDES